MAHATTTAAFGAPNTNPLSAASLTDYIVSSLPHPPAESEGAGGSVAQVKTATDAVAIACHAGMISVGFRLVGLGEDHQIDAISDSKNPQALPKEWNDSSSSHAFRYKHSQSSMQYLLKVSRLGNKTVVYGLGMGHDKTASFDITTGDYVSASSLPASFSPTSTEASMRDAVTDIFISRSRLSDFGSLLKLNIIQKLIPSLQKEGYEEQQSETSNTRESTTGVTANRYQQEQGSPLVVSDINDASPEMQAFTSPLRGTWIGRADIQPPVPVGGFPPPGFEDEFELQNTRAHGNPGTLGGYHPNIGEHDLYPAGLGPRDPIPPGGSIPLIGGGPDAMRGGMHPTFDDPIFAGGRRGQGRLRGYDPQVPPGARYDPLIPPSENGSFGGRSSYRSRDSDGPGGFGGGGAPHNPYSGFGPGDFI